MTKYFSYKKYWFDKEKDSLKSELKFKPSIMFEVLVFFGIFET